jgi:hypothetical protein
MGLLDTIKRFLDARDSYDTAHAFYSMRPYLNQSVIDKATKGLHADLAGSDAEPEELLPDVEFDSHTPGYARRDREAALARERQRREQERG